MKPNLSIEHVIVGVIGTIVIVYACIILVGIFA